MSVWLYELARPFHYRAEQLSGIRFYNEWISIDRGWISIRPGYAWDGCTPKIVVRAGYYIGVWDGPIMSDGYPQTAWASLVHDALCQFRHEIPIRKRATVDLFDLQLREANWRLRSLYVAAVNIFGPQRFAGDV